MLKEIRVKRGYTQEELSELTKVDPRTILRIEKNFTTPKVDTYAKIVIALGLTNEEIGEHVRNIALESNRAYISW